MFRMSAIVPVGLHIVLLASFSGLSAAQTPASSPTADSLVRMLASPDWRLRSDAIVRLNLVPRQQLPNAYATTVIQLFEREALESRQQSEGYGEYLLDLMQGVVRLRDPRSLRGLALLGIHMSREAQEYVASQGGASLPFLDEAWQRGHSDAVAETWAYMLTRYDKALTRPERLQVMARFLAVAPANSRAFSWAAEIGPVPDVVPIIEEIESSEPQVMRKRAATNALNKLRPLRNGMSPRDLSTRLEDWVEAMCLDASGARASTCQNLRERLKRAKDEVQARGLGAAKPTLAAVVDEVDPAKAPGLNNFERRLIAGNAQHLLRRPS